jgi:hypothetical protein
MVKADLKRLELVLLSSCLLMVCACQTAQAQTGKSGGKPDAPKPSAGASAQIKESMKWEAALDGQSVEVFGKVRRVGNDPFSRLVITDSGDHDWDVDKEGQKTLSMRETQTVSVSAIVKVLPQLLANGKRLPDKKELTQVKMLD